MTDAHLFSLPPELLARVVQYLPGSDLPNVCLSCKKLREVVLVDLIWEKRCRVEYGFSSAEGWKRSYREIYTKVLWKYGSAIGLWQRDFRPYGGLLQVKYEAGHIKGIEWLPPISPHVSRSLRKKDLFSIRFDDSGEVKVTSLVTIQKQLNACDICVSVDKTTNMKALDVKVKGKKNFSKEELEDWLSEELGQDNAQLFYSLYYHKGKKFLKDRCEYHCTQCAVPPPQPNVPIQPGLFKGTYSAHGIEILSLDYNTDQTELLATKITGDPNIPATKVSVKADLQALIVLTLEQQEMISTVCSVEPTNEIPETQPFKVPRDCHDRDIEISFKSCAFRCMAEGQIAQHNYMNPSFTPGHFVVFDDDTFAMIWFELSSLSLYSRVKESFAGS